LIVYRFYHFRFEGCGATIAKLSIALDVPNRDDDNSILNVLERLANTARNDLLRRKASIVSGYGRSQHYNDKTKA
jgi:hypothetical protein